MKRQLLFLTPCLVLLIGSVWVQGSIAEAAMIGNTLPNGIYMQRKVKSLKIPAIVLLDSGKYSHFVVLKGVKGGKAYIADPAFGNRSMDMGTFNSNWNNKIIFVVVGKNATPASQLNYDDALQAPELDVITIRQLGAGGGYSTFPSLNEF